MSGKNNESLCLREFTETIQNAQDSIANKVFAENVETVKTMVAECLRLADMKHSSITINSQYGQIQAAIYAKNTRGQPEQVLVITFQNQSRFD